VADDAEGLSAFTTVPRVFYDWRDDGLFERFNFALLLPRARRPAAKKQNNEPIRPGHSTVNRPRPPSGRAAGDDAAKKIKGRKRHIVTILASLLVGAR